MAKIWVLDTDTKGTGAEMVPLEKVLRKPDPKPEPRFVASAPEPRAEREPEPKPPASFRVIDVMTREVLAERAGTRETVELLEGTRSVVDVNIEVWNPEAKIWHRLTHGERKVLWELRGRRGRGARSQAAEPYGTSSLPHIPERRREQVGDSAGAGRRHRSSLQQEDLT